jgi:hypothetical protein
MDMVAGRTWLLVDKVVEIVKRQPAAGDFRDAVMGAFEGHHPARTEDNFPMMGICRTRNPLAFADRRTKK